MGEMPFIALDGTITAGQIMTALTLIITITLSFGNLRTKVNNLVKAMERFDDRLTGLSEKVASDLARDERMNALSTRMNDSFGFVNNRFQSLESELRERIK